MSSIQSTGRRIVEGVMYTSFGKMSVQVSSFITFLIIIKSLTLKDYGLLQLLFSFLGPAAAISMMGIERLIVSDVAVYRAQKAFGTIKKIFKEYFTSTSSILILLFVISWFMRGFLNRFYDIDITTFYWALIFLIIGQVGMNFTSVIFEAYERFNLAAFAKFGESFVRLGLIISYFFWFGFTLQSVFWAYIIGKLATTLISIPFAFFLIWQSEGDIGEEKVILGIIKKHGKWEVISHIARTSADNIWPWLLNILVSIEAVALFAFVQKIKSLAAALIPIRGVLFPILASSLTKSRELAIIIATKSKKYLFFLYVLLYGAIFLLIEPFVLHYSPQYIEAINLVRIASLHLFIDVLTLGQTAVFYALKQQRISFALNILSFVLTLITQVLFTYLWGVVGLIMSWLLVGIVLSVVKEYILKVHLNMPLWHWQSFFIFDTYDRLIVNKIKDRAFKIFNAW